MKNELDKYKICDIYQVNPELGYVNITEIRSNDSYKIPRDAYFLSESGDYLPTFKLLDSIVVKESKNPLGRRKEILTGEYFDLVKIYLSKQTGFLHYEFGLSGSKKDYDTFIIERNYSDIVKQELIAKYLEEHKYASRFKEHLTKIKERGSIYHKRKLEKEKKELLKKQKQKKKV